MLMLHDFITIKLLIIPRNFACFFEAVKGLHNDTASFTEAHHYNNTVLSQVFKSTMLDYKAILPKPKKAHITCKASPSHFQKD